MFRHVVDYAPTVLGLKEVYTLGMRMEKSLAAPFAADTYVSGQLIKVKGAGQVIEKTLVVSRKSVYSKVLSEKHVVRGKAFRSFLKYLDAFAAVPLKAEQCAKAQQVLVVIEKYGRNADRLGYAKGTATFKAMLRELQEETLAALISELDATDLVSQLEAAQNDFEASYMQKVEFQEHPVQPSALAARDDLIYHLTNCMQYIDSLVDDDPVKYAAVLDDINAINLDLTTPARARHTRQVKEAQEVTAPQPLPTVK